jgi:hypothetical protein
LGAKYHTLNWSCDRQPNERQDEYSTRSYELGFKAIEDARNIADEKGDGLMFVLVI